MVRRRSKRRDCRTGPSGTAKSKPWPASFGAPSLARLAKAGLVEARTDGHYYVYSLQTNTLREMSQRMLQEEQLPRLAESSSEDAFERKVLANFTGSPRSNRRLVS